MHTVGGMRNWCSRYGKQYGDSLKKLRIGLPCDPATSLLGIYLDNMKTLTQLDVGTPVFIAALFTTAKLGKYSQCPPMFESIKKMLHTRTHTHRNTM